MTTSVQTFAFKTTGSDQPVNIRTIEIDGEPWFVAADVCTAISLGYDNARGVTKFITHLDPADRQRVNRNTTASAGGIPQRGNPYIVVISENGLYRLIMRSDKPEAREFQDWVTREVLPAIRKTGGYLLNEAARETAHADTRTEMPLPAAFQEAMNTLARANVLMGEKLERALVIMDRQDVQLTAQNAAMARLEAIFSERQDTRMMTVSQLITSAIVGRGNSISIGQRLSAYCKKRSVELGQVENIPGQPTRTYPVWAARSWAAGE